MPEETTITETPTAAALELKKQTDAALKQVTGGGFDDPEFEASLQAAIDKDLGKAPETKTEPPPADKAKADDATKADEKKPLPTAEDIPAELLGEKKPEAKAEPTPEAAEAERQKFIAEQTKGMTPKASERFKTIEARAFEAEKKAKQIEAERVAEKAAVQKQIEELNLKAAAKVDDAEVEKLRKQVEDLDAVIQKAALQEHPKFKAHYDDKISMEIEEAKKVVPAEASDELAQLMSIPVSKKRNDRIKEIVEELDDLDKLKVLGSVRDVDRLSAERANELSKWKENRIHLEADALKQQEQQAKQVQEIQQVAWAKGMGLVTAPDTGMEVFRKTEGNDEWNAKVEERVAKVRTILTSANPPPEKLVEIAAKSVAADDYRRMFLAQRVLVQRLNEELAELKSSQPNPGEGDAGESGGAPDNDDFITAVTKGAIKSGALRE